MNKEIEEFIDHEVRIRVQERIAKEIKEAIIHLENRMESRFTLLIGLILTSMFLPVIFHALKWM